MFDGLCRNIFFQVLAQYNDYGIETTLDDVLEQFMYAVQHKAFLQQLKVLTSTRGVNGNNEREEEGNRDRYKQHQILFHLLSLIRMSNPIILTWWVMIQGDDNFGWGVGATLSGIN